MTAHSCIRVRLLPSRAGSCPRGALTTWERRRFAMVERHNVPVLLDEMVSDPGMVLPLIGRPGAARLKTMRR